MHGDEEQIRALVDTWMAAIRAADLDTVSLMTEDVVFLMPGRPQMRTWRLARDATACSAS